MSVFINYVFKKLFLLHYAYAGATPVKLGHVKTTVVSAVPASNASQESVVREWALTLAASSTSSSEETIFLSPL